MCIKSQTLKPSARRHIRWASIHFAQASSPCSTMHSSLSFFVSGQAQQIFFFGFDSAPVVGFADSWFCCKPGKANVDVFCVGNPPIFSGSKWFQGTLKQNQSLMRKENEEISSQSRRKSILAVITGMRNHITTTNCS